MGAALAWFAASWPSGTDGHFGSLAPGDDLSLLGLAAGNLKSGVLGLGIRRPPSDAVGDIEGVRKADERCVGFGGTCRFDLALSR